MPSGRRHNHREEMTAWCVPRKTEPGEAAKEIAGPSARYGPE